MSAPGILDDSPVPDSDDVRESGSCEEGDDHPWWIVKLLMVIAVGLLVGCVYLALMLKGTGYNG
jgi:hypothetical protein